MRGDEYVWLIGSGRGKRQGALSLGREALDLPRHEVDDVVRHCRSYNGIHLKNPEAAVVVELEQPFLTQRLQELLHEERVSISFLQNQTGERLGLLEFSMEGVADQESKISKSQRIQEEALYRSAGRFQRA